MYWLEPRRKTLLTPFLSQKRTEGIMFTKLLKFILEDTFTFWAGLKC